MPSSEMQIIQYVQRIRELLAENEEHAGAANHAITVFARLLERRYAAGALNACALFHAVIGSAASGPTPRFDFPGDDSILTFLEGLATDLAPKEFVKLKEKFDRESRR